jgi:hypothetical protein
VSGEGGRMNAILKRMMISFQKERILLNQFSEKNDLQVSKIVFCGSFRFKGEEYFDSS